MEREALSWFSHARRFTFALMVGLLLVTAGAGRAFGHQSDSQSQSDTKDKSADTKKSDTDKQDPPKNKDSDAPTTKLRIEITDPHDKPVANASVYVRFNQSGGMFHKDKLAELNLRTNEDGTVKVPEIPQGKILIQVIAKGWRTYGKWYDIEKVEDTIEIKLEEPPHWY
ncbi:MAG TPA: carboxypeptidase-like regulatory domain-containing protein [Candidatus Limnocylindrales bacterium]|nr:carboxypeptidase-like regulatory domain-containing protein [Candidatus Limnocylindrales bacterium]